MRRSARQAGVTLIELVVTITVLGVLASMGATMMSGPARSFVQGGDRSLMTDAADRAVRRMSEEIRGSLPNSLRVTQSGPVAWVEFLPVSDSGRMRLKPTSGGAGDPLDFGNTADNAFDVFGELPTLYADSQLVINNLGTPEGDAWTGGNRRAGLSLDTVGKRLRFTPNGAFPSEPPTGRFSVVRAPVSFRCEGGTDAEGAAIGTLRRYGGYPIAATQPLDAAAAPLTGATVTTLATGVKSCSVAYDNAQANLGLMTIRLELGSGDVRVALSWQLMVDNTP